MKGRVFMICGDDETAKNVGDCLKRVASTMSAMDTYFDKICELDEDAPDFEDKFAPVLSRLTMTMMAIYPNPKQIQGDIQSIGDFTVRKIEL